MRARFAVDFVCMFRVAGSQALVGFGPATGNRSALLWSPTFVARQSVDLGAASSEQHRKGRVPVKNSRWLLSLEPSARTS